MKKFLLPAVIVLFSLQSFSQLLTWTPNFPVESSTPVVITVDAAKGNQGLLNYTPVTDMYVHIGVITNLSTGPTDWKYVKFTWGTTLTAAQATSLGSNKWSYTITGGLRTFFGITNASETIQKIAILFRNGSGARVQRNTDGSDMYIPVYTTALAVRFTEPLLQPTFIPKPEPITKNIGDNINMLAVANKGSTMKLYLNGVLLQTASGTTSINANPVISTSGTQMLVAEANDAAVTKYDTISFFVAPAVTIAPLPPGVRKGINYESGDTSITLVLYAPQKNRVAIIGEFAGSNWIEQTQYLMNKTPDGNYWWKRVTGLTPGTEYAFQYLVDGTLKVADPYSEKILDPWNDPFISSTTYPSLKPYPAGQSGIVGVLQTARPAYNWAVPNFTRPDKRNLMIYELLLPSFVAAHDWKTLKDTLNYLKNLGINAIKIMPFNEFDGNISWGYNPSFYFAPDKYYGPRNSLKEFIDACHKKGIAVIMDMVLNHATGQSPLAALYWDAVNNRPAANNPWFNVTAKHPFNVYNDFNHESAVTQYHFNRVTEHWLKEYKIDGFRFDLSKGFTQVNSGSNVAAWGNYDASRIAIWKRYYDSLQVYAPGSYVILEHFADNTEEIELSNYGMLLWGNLNNNFSEASMGFLPNSNFEWGLHSVRGWTNPHLITYMESHDEERLMYKNLQFGNSSGTYNIRDLNTALKRIEMNAAFLFTMPGPKMIWQFGELGYDFSINRCPDGTINTNCRLDLKPIRWDYLQVTQRKRLYDIHSNLLKLRFHPLYKDAFVSNRVGHSLGAAFKWLQVTTDTSNIFVIGNFDVIAVTGTVTFQNAGTWYNYLNGSTFTATGTAQNITLQPGEYRVFLNRNISPANGGLVTPPVTDTIDSGSQLLINVFPNPMNENAVLEIETPENGMVQASLWTIEGKKALDIYSGFLQKGSHLVPVFSNFDSKKLPSGTYILKVENKNQFKSLKVLLK